MHSPHLIDIIKCHHNLPQWQCPLTATLQFQQRFVLNPTPLQMNLICFSSHLRLLNWSLELVDQLISSQCAIEELKRCCFYQYTYMVYNAYFPMPTIFLLTFNHHYVTYVDFESLTFVFQFVFSLRATRYSCFYLFHKASLYRLTYLCCFL